MGAPSDEQIDSMIAWGLANRWSEAAILKRLATLERWTDEELAAIGVYPPNGRQTSKVTKFMDPRSASTGMHHLTDPADARYRTRPR
jgi:hypothetical protein